eukprot:COSAG06_NODE_15917_length_1035_cov_1.297009_2_plen_38_part_01
MCEVNIAPQTSKIHDGSAEMDTKFTKVTEKVDQAAAGK